MDVKSTPSYLYWLFCQFELITCSYLMEPWEKVLFYSFNLAMLGLLLYTTYVCCFPINISPQQFPSDPDLGPWSSISQSTNRFLKQ
uniref:Serine palmitoyltransferase small subunit B n=1 Tax=Cyanistes caeruleus TaxID=156563 RepID=A0A8C0UCH1_CYACU